MQYKRLLDKIDLIKHGVLKPTRFIIDVETLEIFKGTADAAKKLGCWQTQINNSIALFEPIKGHLLEYFDEWVQWDNWEKERYSKTNHIYFL